MQKRKLGNITVSEIGMGCMAFSHGYGKIPEEQYSVEAIREAYDYGCTFFDTAEIYSPDLRGIGHNERIVGEALKGVRENIVIATKFFVDRGEIRGSETLFDVIFRHFEGSCTRLKTDIIDIYYLHRMPHGISIEEIAEAMGRLIDEEYIRGWGLSQSDTDIIRKAHSVTPLSAVQNIYSVVERYCEKSVIPYCLKHNIGFVPFSPVASGLLSGKIDENTRFEKRDDVRNWVPQLSRANIAKNQPIVDILRYYADKKDASPAQISLAWMLYKYPNLVPIPGSKNKKHIIENLDAANITFTPEEFNSLEKSLNELKVYGHRGLSM